MSPQTNTPPNQNSGSWGEANWIEPNQPASSPAPRVENPNTRRSIDGALLAIFIAAALATVLAMLLLGGNTEPPSADGATTIAPPATDAPVVVSTLPEMVDPVETVPPTSSGAIPIPTGELVTPSALYTNGTVTLEGGQPTQQAADALAAAAAEILGEENVINNYVVDPRATTQTMGDLEVWDTLHFNPGTEEPDEGSFKVMETTLLAMQSNPDAVLTIIGHTNNIDNAVTSLRRSVGYAESIADFYRNAGIDEERLIVVGQGGGIPLLDNDTPEGERLNERAQFVLS